MPLPIATKIIAKREPFRVDAAVPAGAMSPVAVAVAVAIVAAAAVQCMALGSLARAAVAEALN